MLKCRLDFLLLPFLSIVFQIPLLYNRVNADAYYIWNFFTLSLSSHFYYATDYSLPAAVIYVTIFRLVCSMEVAEGRKFRNTWYHLILANASWWFESLKFSSCSVAVELLHSLFKSKASENSLWIYSVISLVFEHPIR